MSVVQANGPNSSGLGSTWGRFLSAVDSNVSLQEQSTLVLHLSGSVGVCVGGVVDLIIIINQLEALNQLLQIPAWPVRAPAAQELLATAEVS